MVVKCPMGSTTLHTMYPKIESREWVHCLSLVNRPALSHQSVRTMSIVDLPQHLATAPLFFLEGTSRYVTHRENSVTAMAVHALAMKRYWRNGKHDRAIITSFHFVTMEEDSSRHETSSSSGSEEDVGDVDDSRSITSMSPPTMTRSKQEPRSTTAGDPAGKTNGPLLDHSYCLGCPQPIVGSV